MFTRTFTGIIASTRSSGIVLTLGILYDDANYYPESNGPNACTPTVIPPNPPPAPTPVDIYYTFTGTLGNYIYSDATGTTPFDGAFGWWKINTGSDIAVQVSTSGEILDTFVC